MRFLAPLLAATVLFAFSCAGPPQPAREIDLIPEVAIFLQAHSDFGQPVATQAVPDWANGKRQRVSFDSERSLLFYTRNGEVVTVWEDQPGKGRVVVWGETDTYDAPAVVAKAAEAGLPSYTVLFSVEKFGGGGRFGDVLVSGISRNTPAAEREALARRIGTKENLVDVSLYSTEEAYKANMSESFAKAHPDAMRRGFLGTLKDGAFSPGEALYP